MEFANQETPASDELMRELAELKQQSIDLLVKLSDTGLLSRKELAPFNKENSRIDQRITEIGKQLRANENASR